MTNEPQPEPIEAVDLDELTEALAWPPIPPEEIKKGHTLTAQRLVELGAMTGDPASARWAFRLLALRDEIVRTHKVSVRILKGGLRINTDAEASEYHNGKADHAVGSIKRQVGALHRLVDVSALTSAEQAAHDRSLCLWGARLAGIKRAAKALDGGTNKIQ